MFFSGPIGITGKHNSKNDIVWSKSKEDAGELLDHAYNKFEKNVMVWGGVHYTGLFPPNGPIFMHELKQRVIDAGVELGQRGGINGAAYAYMITEEVLPLVRQLYGGREVWQDDNARIHRGEAALEACREFAQRIPVHIQAPKMADVWPVENLWAILNDRVKKREPQTSDDRCLYIVEEWIKIDQDKALCRRLMRSIPKRLDAVIKVEGRQIRREDYKDPMDANNNNDNINNNAVVPAAPQPQ